MSTVTTRRPERYLAIDSVSLVAGSAAKTQVTLRGPATGFAAFNFDIVYNQTLVSLGTPAANLGALNTPDRSFQCDLPPPSADIDPDPVAGRARLVCFSFGGGQASAPASPTPLATVELTGVTPGRATLSFENIAVFAPDGKKINVGSDPVSLEIK